MINTDMFVVRYIQICLSFVTYRYVCRSSHRYVRCVMWTFFSVIWQCVLLQFTHVDCRFLLGCCVTITSHSQVGTCIIFLCALVCTCSFIEVYRLCLHGYFIFFYSLSTRHTYKLLWYMLQIFGVTVLLEGSNVNYKH